MRPDSLVTTPDGESIFYLGPPLSEGVKPTILYFALSAEMTLFQDPFNQPAIEWAKNGIRVFSWNLPFHTSDADPHVAISKWAVELAQNPYFISDFIQRCLQNLSYLEGENLIDKAHLAVAGLSRGGFMATHLAAQHPQIQWILGFAPLTQPDSLQEFRSTTQTVGLTHLVDQLTETHTRFYIGNHDTRVNTESCFTFINTLSKKSFAKGVRTPKSELIIYPSIGHRGHGTPPAVFKDGATWLQDQLVNRASI